MTAESGSLRESQCWCSVLARRYPSFPYYLGNGVQLWSNLQFYKLLGQSVD